MMQKIGKWLMVLSERFSALSKPCQRRTLLLLAAFLFASLLWLIFLVEPRLNGTKIGVISIPIVRQSNDKNMRQEQLIPLVKMKGEVNGEFDSFYVAIDKNARIFINRDIDYGPNAFAKSKKWEEITRTKLAEYERDLSFRPINQKSKSLKP